MGGSMKVHHQFARVLWEHEPSLTLAAGCNKRLRPLAPKLSTSSPTFDLKSFIRPQSSPTKLSSSDDTLKKDPPSPQSQSQPQVETQIPGGTRWNPTQEQIGILEMLYRSGMRTPNAQQIEQITGQLSKYGKIEGKNVFYWFQNHKARERQKQKRSNTLALSRAPRTPLTAHTIPLERRDDDEEDSPYKKKCKRWALLMEQERCKDEHQAEEEEHRTLELFPLHPEGMR